LFNIENDPLPLCENLRVRYQLFHKGSGARDSSKESHNGFDLIFFNSKAVGVGEPFECRA
jgi:hypothetical protein